MELYAKSLSFSFSEDKTKELIRSLTGEKYEPKFDVVVEYDPTEKDLLSYEELYDKMKDYENRLREIKNFDSYSLNHFINKIESLTEDI